VHTEKKISVASYWLGIACVVMTVSHLARACGPGDLANPDAGKVGPGVTYITLHPASGASLLLLSSPRA
jgi:hypothetical protein